MDRNSRAIVSGTRTATTVNNIGTVLDVLEANYGSRLYKDTDRKNVVALWSSRFSGDDPAEVLKAVMDWIDAESFPPTVADIKKIMRKNRKPEQQSVDEIIENANRIAAIDRKLSDDLREKYEARVENFLAPLTKIEIKIIKKREDKRDMRYVS